MDCFYIRLRTIVCVRKMLVFFWDYMTESTLETEIHFGLLSIKVSTIKAGHKETLRQT